MAEFESPLLLTVPQVAATLSVSRSTVYQLISSGRLRAIRVADRCCRIPRGEVNEYIARQIGEVA